MVLISMELLEVSYGNHDQLTGKHKLQLLSLPYPVACYAYHKSIQIHRRFINTTILAASRRTRVSCRTFLFSITIPRVPSASDSRTLVLYQD